MWQNCVDQQIKVATNQQYPRHTHEMFVETLCDLAFLWNPRMKKKNKNVPQVQIRFRIFGIIKDQLTWIKCVEPKKYMIHSICYVFIHVIQSDRWPTIGPRLYEFVPQFNTWNLFIICVRYECRSGVAFGIALIVLWITFKYLRPRAIDKFHLARQLPLFDTDSTHRKRENLFFYYLILLLFIRLEMCSRWFDTQQCFDVTLTEERVLHFDNLGNKISFRKKELSPFHIICGALLSKSNFKQFPFFLFTCCNFHFCTIKNNNHVLQL